MFNEQDQWLLEGIRNGESAQLSMLYKDVLPSIQRLASQAGLTADDARDVFQDAVMVVFEKAGQPGFILTSRFSTYFYGICKNIIGNRLKKKSGKHVTINDDLKYREDENAQVQADMEAAEKHRLFHRAFKKLGDDCRTLLEMAFENQPPETIMHVLGIASYDYFRRRKYLCKEKLIKLVKEDPAYNELLE